MDHDVPYNKIAETKIKMGDLLCYLQQFDKQWLAITIKEMKTTPPRTLISNMNTYVARLLARPEQVQKVIKSIPQSADQSADLQVAEKGSRTISDNLSPHFEEVKPEKKPWDDQEYKNSNDQPLTTPKKVAKGSKAGTNKSPREQEHQETTE